MPEISTLPYGGLFFGMCTPSPDVTAYRYDVKAAIRFMAEHTGNVTHVRWANRSNVGAETGFSTGNGGTIRIDLETNNPATNEPSGVAIGTTASQTVAAEIGAYPLVAFTAPVPLVKDTIYHLVFRQLNSAGGTVSLQSLDTAPNGVPEFPYDRFWRVFRSSGAGWQVGPDPVPDPEEPPPVFGGLPKLPPGTGTVRQVPEDGTLATVYAAANAGDIISLASATYAGNYTFARSFPTNNPVIIKSRTGQGAVFTGKIFNHAGQGHWFHMLKTTYAGTAETDGAVYLGNWSIMTKCWLDSPRAIILQAYATTTDDGSAAAPKHHIWVGWNRFTGQGAANEISHLKVYKKDGIQTHMEFSDIYIYRNFWTDLATPTAGDNTFHIYIGNSQPFDGIYPGMPNDGGIPIFDNFYIHENYMSASSTRTRFAYLKTGVTEVARNHTASGTGGVFTQRTGRGTRYWGNRSSDGYFLIKGGGTVSLFCDLRRNAFTGGGVGYRLESGYLTAADHHAADYALMFANTGRLMVGYIPDGQSISAAHGGKVNGVKIYQHAGTVDAFDAALVDVATIVQSTGNPANIINPPVVAGVTDANGTVLSTFGPLDTGMEVANQERAAGEV